MARATEAGLQLGELLTVEPLGLRLITGSPEQLTRRVSWAHATEMADPSPHLRSDELVCTVGSALITAENCARFVKAVKAADSSGICLGLGEVHTKAPDALVRQCRKWDVALIEVSHGVPFLAINDVLVDARSAAQASGTARSGQLTAELLQALHTGTPVAGILSLAAEALGGAITFESGNVTYAAGDGGSGTTGGSAGDGTQRIRSSLSATETIHWVGVDPPDALLLDQLGRILQIAVHEKDASDIDHRRQLGQLATLIADGLAQPAALAQELQAIGLERSALTVSAWPAGTGQVLHEQLRAALVAETPDMTFVVSGDAPSLHNAAETLGLVCGFSSQVRLPELRRGLTEARTTLQIARGRGSVAGPETLTTLESLLEQQPLSRLAPFADQLIRPLLDPVNRAGTELVETLRRFLASGGSIQATADALFLHVNSVRHRLNRIAAITGRNPLDAQHRADFTIAVWTFDHLSGEVPARRR